MEGEGSEMLSAQQSLDEAEKSGSLAPKSTWQTLVQVRIHNVLFLGWPT